MNRSDIDYWLNHKPAAGLPQVRTPADIQRLADVRSDQARIDAEEAESREQDDYDWVGEEVQRRAQVAHGKHMAELQREAMLKLTTQQINADAERICGIRIEMLDSLSALDGAA